MDFGRVPRVNSSCLVLINDLRLYLSPQNAYANRDIVLSLPVLFYNELNVETELL